MLKSYGITHDSSSWYWLGIVALSKTRLYNSSKLGCFVSLVVVMMMMNWVRGVSHIGNPNTFRIKSILENLSIVFFSGLGSMDKIVLFTKSIIWQFSNNYKPLLSSTVRLFLYILEHTTSHMKLPYCTHTVKPLQNHSFYFYVHNIDQNILIN